MPRWTKALEVAPAVNGADGDSTEATDQNEGSRQGSDEDAAVIEAQLQSEGLGMTHLIPVSEMPPPSKTPTMELGRRESMTSTTAANEPQNTDANSWYVGCPRSTLWVAIDTIKATISRPPTEEASEADR